MKGRVWCPDRLWEAGLGRSACVGLSPPALLFPIPDLRQLGVASKGKGGGSLGLRRVFARILGGPSMEKATLCSRIEGSSGTSAGLLTLPWPMPRTDKL